MIIFRIHWILYYFNTRSFWVSRTRGARIILSLIRGWMNGKSQKWIVNEWILHPFFTICNCDANKFCHTILTFVIFSIATISQNKYKNKLFEPQFYVQYISHNLISCYGQSVSQVFNSKINFFTLINLTFWIINVHLEILHWP